MEIFNLGTVFFAVVVHQKYGTIRRCMEDKGIWSMSSTITPQTAYKEFPSRKLTGVGGEALQVVPQLTSSSLRSSLSRSATLQIAKDLSLNIFDSIKQWYWQTATPLFDIAEGRTRAAKFVAWAPSLWRSTKASVNMLKSSSAKSANVCLTQTSVNIVRRAEGWRHPEYGWGPTS